MPSPVLNWRSQTGETSLFPDSGDPALLHFAPRLAWRALRSSQVGNRRLYAGDIDLGYEAAEMAALKTALPGRRLSALAGDTEADVRLVLAVAPPHTARVGLMNGLPFGMLKFNATIDLSAAGGPELAAAIERAWMERGLLVGSIVHRFAGVHAHGGYAVQLDYKACATALRDRIGSRRLSALDAREITAGVVNQNAGWLVYEGQDERPGERDTAEAALAEAFVNGCWEPAEPFERYDSGFAFSSVRVRNPASLRGPDPRKFIRTAPQPGEVALMRGELEDASGLRAERVPV
jgi:hypothetical protein